LQRKRESNKLEKILSNIGRTILYLVARPTCYGLSVAIFSAGFAGIVSTVFALYYFDAVNISVSPEFLLILKISISLWWLILATQHGLFFRVGIKGWGEPIFLVNTLIKTEKESYIPENLTSMELEKLLEALVKFPIYSTKNIFTWVFVLVLLMIGVGSFTENFSKNFYFSIINIGAIALFNILCITLISSEVITGSMRASCKKMLDSRNIPYQEKANSTVRTKFIFFLLLLGVSLYLAIVVTFYNHDEMNKVVSFSILVVVLSNLFAYMIFKIIYSSLAQIEKAAYQLVDGESAHIYPKSLDKEFINVAIGMNEASKTILDYKHSMEEKVRQRTKELNEAYSQIAQKNELIEQELEFAKNIQQGIIPHNIEPWNGISFATHYEPMGSVSGDYYDVFYFSKHIYVLIADVSGHGVPAALITMTAKQAFSQVIKEDSSPAQIFREANKIITERVKTSDYLSAFLLKIDEKNRLTYANAAHPNIVHYIRSSNEYILLDTEGMFIGAIEEASEHYAEKETKLQSGDRLYLYTDGVIEHKNPEGEEFGINRFIEVISLTKTKSIKEQIDAVRDSLKIFMKTAPIKDDISMFVLELDPSWAKFAESYNQGLKSIREKNFMKALDKFTEGINLIPSFIGLQYQLALVQFYLQNFEDAKKFINEYLKLKPNDIRGIKLGINIFQKLGLEKEADFLSKKLPEKN
jgi:phosphoserine phosphatase RsbU/P